MQLELYLPIFLFAFVTAITPGPNNTILLNSGLNYGVVKTIPCYLGVCSGFAAMVLAIGFGLGNIFIFFPALHQVIQILGVAYLLFLAWKIAMTKTNHKSTISKPINFFQAVLFQWINPKAWTMSAGAISSFTNTDSNIIIQVLIISFIYLISVLPCTAVWVLGGSLLQKIIKKPTHLKIFNFSLAILLVVSLIPILENLLQLL